MELAIRTKHLTKIYAGRVIAVNDLQSVRSSRFGLRAIGSQRGREDDDVAGYSWGCSARRPDMPKCSGMPAASMPRRCGR